MCAGSVLLGRHSELGLIDEQVEAVGDRHVMQRSHAVRRGIALPGLPLAAEGTWYLAECLGGCRTMYDARSHREVVERWRCSAGAGAEVGVDVAGGAADRP